MDIVAQDDTHELMSRIGGVMLIERGASDYDIQMRNEVAGIFDHIALLLCAGAYERAIDCCHKNVAGLRTRNKQVAS